MRISTAQIKKKVASAFLVLLLAFVLRPWMQRPKNSYSSQMCVKYRENTSAFLNVMDHITSVQSLLAVSTIEDSYMQHGYKMAITKEVDNILIQTHFVYPEEIYHGIASICRDFFETTDTKAIFYYREDNFYEILDYVGFSGVSYIYAPSGIAPDIEKYRIDKLISLDDKWFVAVFESTI